MNIRSRQPLAGGDISRVERVELADGRTAVLKTRAAAPADFFAAEAHGLNWLRKPGALRLPEVLDVGPGHLLLEWLAPQPPGSDFAEKLGRALAELHRFPVGPAPGLERDNYIGSLPQSNQPVPGWSEFYARRRLQPLMEKAVSEQLAPASWLSRLERLAGRLPHWLPEQPLSCLHGDLWSGNLLVGPQGQPCLIDPAVYVGDREVDLAMMRLFGGFSERVFSAYQEVLSLAPGWEERVPLYQLYPLLVHLLLFGGGYRGAVERALQALP
ncbi:MAG: fructosamine kinase family protein [Vulcanimicrobiota bacterium]